MIQKFAILGFVLSLSTLAHAQPLMDLSTTSPAGTPGSMSISSFDPTDATAPISVVEGRGWKVGEGTVIHPVFGLSTGLDSNVFSENDPTQAAGVLRLIAQFSVASLPYQRLHPGLDPMAGGLESSKPDRGDNDEGSFQYWASARLAYDQMLSGNSTVNSTSGLGLGLLFRAVVAPQGTFSFSADDNFVRAIRAATFETPDNPNRDVNSVRLALLYQPHDHAISGFLYYHNTVDIFEHSFNQYPDRMFNRVGVHPMWLLFPQTKLYGDISIANVTGIGPLSSLKVTSYPLTAKVGIATLLDLRTTLNFSAGYTNGFYSAGPNFSAATIDSVLAYRYSPRGRVGVGYSLLYQDSINANFFRDHLLRAFITQDMAPVVFMVAPELHFREYEGLTVMGNLPTRDDTIFAVVAGIHYVYRDWLAGVLEYRFSDVNTDFRYMDAMGDSINPSYLRHELLLGMRVAM